jgi:hypothetical protein
MAGGWRRLHNEELRNLNSFAKYYQGNQIKEHEMDGACSTHRGDDKYNILVGKPEEKRPPLRSRHTG